MTHFLYKLWRNSRLVSSRISLDLQTGCDFFARSLTKMEWSSDPDTSFSSLNPTSSKEDFFSTSLVSSTTSEVDINVTLQVDNSLSPTLSTNRSFSPLPQRDSLCRKSKILPPILLQSVTKKVREGIVSKSEISTNDLKTCLASELNDSNNKLISQISPLSVNSSVDSPLKLGNVLSANISDIDSNSSQFNIKAELSGDSDDKALSTNSDTSICTIYSDDETRNKLKIEKPKKPVPNYFISIQFSDPEIYSSLKEMHKSVMKKNGNYSLAVVPLHSLHMTLAVMRLDNEEDMAHAKSALNRCGNELRPKYRHKLLELPLQGLGNFRHSVVFAKVHPGEHVAKLEEIADVVQNKFCEEGLVDRHDFIPHVTVLKLSRVGKKLTKKTGLKKIYPDIYEEFVDTYFGTQEVRSLQLCSMLKAKDISGYYHVEHKIDFGVDVTPDDDNSTSIAMVNGERENSLSETVIESASKQNPELTNSNNPEDVTLQGNNLIKKSLSEKNEVECDVTSESLNKIIYPYKSEMFIHISGSENENNLPELSVFQVEQVTDNSRAQILSTTLQEEALNDNSSVPINLLENVPTSEKLDQEMVISLKVPEKKVLEKETDVVTSEVLDKPVSTKTDLSYSKTIPKLIINQVETVTDNADFMNVTDEVSSSPVNLEEASPSMTVMSNSSSNTIPQTLTTFQDISFINDSSVSDVSEAIATHSQVSSSSYVPGDLEVAEEAIEEPASNETMNLSSGSSQPNKTTDDKDACSITSVDSLNIVPPLMKKRRKKIGKCSVM